MRRLLLLLLAATSLTAQQQQPQMQPGRIRQPQGPTGTITGHIQCADTNAPARLARVSIQRLADPGGNVSGFFGGGGSQASTDLEGSYTITGVQPGTYALRVQYDGYVDPMSLVNVSQWMSTDAQIQQQLRSQLATVTINSSESASLDARIERGGTISGQILYDDGSAASGLNLQIRDVVQATATPNQRQGLPARMLNTNFTRTDDRGNFRITSVPPGEYVVLTVINIPRPPVQIGTTSFRTYNNTQTIYAPNTYHAKQAKTYTVSHADDIGGIVITVPTRGLHAVTGNVVQQANGMPVGGGNVQLTDTDDPAFTLNGQILSDGSYRIDSAPAGNYTLKVSSAFEPQSVPASGPVNHYYGTTQVALTVTGSDVSGVTLQVPALDDPTHPPPGTQIRGVRR